jgi:hypothetical protein
MQDVFQTKSPTYKNSGATLGQIMNANLFRQFLMTLDKFGHEIIAIEMVIF